MFKYRVRGDKLEIEIKCYNCNTYNYFTVWLNKANKDIFLKPEKVIQKIIGTKYKTKD